MAKFKVGDRVRCAELKDDDGYFHVPEIDGVVSKVPGWADDRKRYEVRHDTGHENGYTDEVWFLWWYDESDLTLISTPRITPIEWYTPSECLPYEGAKVLFQVGDHTFGGMCNRNMFINQGAYYMVYSPIDVSFWAYAPEVE